MKTNLQGLKTFTHKEKLGKSFVVVNTRHLQKAFLWQICYDYKTFLSLL